MGKKKRTELYNLDISLGKIISKRLSAFERAAVGTPTCLYYEKIDGELKEVRTTEEACKYWHKLLKQMIWSFKEIGKGRPHEPTMRDLEWKDYKQQMDKYDKKVQRGIDLFAEYYQGLWI